MPQIVVMGQGYVGLPLAIAAVNAGHTITGYEPDKQRLDQLREGRSYVEDISDKELRAALDSRRYMPTRSEAYLADFDVAVITVPTPLTNRQPDLRHVREATTVLARHLKAGALVVLESTTHPGTTRDVVVPILEKATGWTAGADFHVGFSPERIDPGNRVWTFENTPKIVAGLTPRCRDKAEEFYRTVTKNVVLADALEEAELAKVFENTYRQVNIALVNELQRLAHVLGVDVWRTLGLADSKPFGFTRFFPGPGVGGHCLPVDPVFLSHHTRTQHGETFRIVELAQDINDSQPAYVVQRLQDTLNGRFHRGVYGARILALGLAYKAGTADHRESPAGQVVSLLEGKGALVDCLDPHVPPAAVGASPKVFGPHTTPPWPLRDYDAVVLLTPHDEFDLQHIAAHAAYVLDTRGVMPDASNIERL